jgi:hypothetical protein
MLFAFVPVSFVLDRLESRWSLAGLLPPYVAPAVPFTFDESMGVLAPMFFALLSLLPQENRLIEIPIMRIVDFVFFIQIVFCLELYKYYAVLA